MRHVAWRHGKGGKKQEELRLGSGAQSASGGMSGWVISFLHLMLHSPGCASPGRLG